MNKVFCWKTTKHEMSSTSVEIRILARMKIGSLLTILIKSNFSFIIFSSLYPVDSPGVRPVGLRLWNSSFAIFFFFLLLLLFLKELSAFFQVRIPVFLLLKVRAISSWARNWRAHVELETFRNKWRKLSLFMQRKVITFRLGWTNIFYHSYGCNLMPPHRG